MRVMTFAQFLNEERVKHVEDIKISDGSDEKLEAEVATAEVGEEECPRCGEVPEECSCPTDDFWSTQNYHRAPKGEVEKSKPKQEFKQTK